ncbi:DUF4232 domain-containing protein [Actinoplanes sp. TBRC 11911]|uniref:DUF4232 domain-containing protein n=1 Tax=Actinoplanes sp. TBRC 11911 TaxID=2729386 RepID=UPI00145EA921|nr:DUF4232 domain-containing protein [Actinoplanes sp. TBRC 11911]NMO57396.1 DUF4232 domain-containing protein [Actinoplanes sp. TBRC 11911]
MTHRSLRLLLLGALGVAFSLALAACGDGGVGAATPAAAPSSPPVPVFPSDPPRTFKPSSEPATHQSVARACRTADTSATITLQPDLSKGSTQVALVQLTNKSKNNCAVNGRAAISLANAAGDTVDVTTSNVNEPGKAVRITLRPGTSAFEGIKWTTCDKGDASCPAGNSLRFNLDAATDGSFAKLSAFPPGEASDITMKSLRIGTLQPSRQGVVAW